MKRIASVLLCAVMLIFVASGCGVEGAAAINSSGAVSASEAAPASEAVDDHPQSAAEVPAAPEDDPPDNDWQFDTPENHGVDGGLLDELYAAIGETNIYSVVIAKDGYIIDEYYKDGYDENSVFRLASCSKSFSGALIGIAIDRGLLGGVDVKLSEFYPQLAASNDALKQEITIEHLLTHTSGIQWSEWNGGTMFREFTRSENWVDFVLNQPMSSKPGEVFNYTTGGSHMLSAVLQQATGQTAFDFALEHLFKPLGMDSVEWRADPQGITDGGNGVSMTARDAAKFGQLYLDGGKWKGRQIIPEDWVAESVKIQYPRSGNTGSYGYQWWIRPFGEKNYNTYYAMGHGGQFIFVVPELKLVTVMTSRLQDTYIPQYYFNDYVIAACAQ